MSLESKFWGGNGMPQLIKFIVKRKVTDTAIFSPLDSHLKKRARTKILSFEVCIFFLTDIIDVD